MYGTVKCSTVQYSTVRYGNASYSKVQCSTGRYSTVQCSIVQYNSSECSTIQCSTVQYSTVELRILHSNCDSTQYWACLMWFVCQSNLNNYRILAYLITLLSFLYLVYILSFLILSIFSPHPRFNLLCPLLYTSAESACTVHSLFNCLFCYLWRLLCDAGSEDRTEQDRIGRSTSMLLMSWFWNLYLNYS